MSIRAQSFSRAAPPKAREGRDSEDAARIEGACAVVSDGCSAAEDSALGARLWARILARCAQSAELAPERAEALWEEARGRALRQWLAHLNELGIEPEQALCGSLAARWREHADGSALVSVELCCDGFAALYRGAQLSQAWIAQPSDGAPLYPMYLAHGEGAERLESLARAWRAGRAPALWRELEGGVWRERAQEIWEPRHLDITLAPGDMLILGSDGLQSIEIDQEQALRELGAMKSRAGKALSRRANAQLERWGKEQGLSAGDDLTLVAIINDEARGDQNGERD